MTDEDRRRCPWCWEWIPRTAAQCEHCGKDVHPLKERSTEAEPLPAGAEPDTAAPGPEESLLATAPREAERAVSGTHAVVMWWTTGVLIYAALLFGVVVVLPFPSATVGILLFLAELAVAYVLNRLLWKRIGAWSAAKVNRLAAYFALGVVILVVLGWVRRRFLG